MFATSHQYLMPNLSETDRGRVVYENPTKNCIFKCCGLLATAIGGSILRQLRLGTWQHPWDQHRSHRSPEL